MATRYREAVIVDPETGEVKEFIKGFLDLKLLRAKVKPLEVIEASVLKNVRYIRFELGRPVMKLEPAVSGFASGFRKLLTLESPAPKRSEPKENQLVINLLRMMGLGDICMSIPSLYALKEKFGDDCYIRYWTSDGGALMLYNLEVVDEIRTVNFPHPRSGLPELPEFLPKDEVCINWVNRVDFGKVVLERPRADNFLLSLNQQLESFGLETATTPRGFKIPYLRLPAKDVLAMRELLFANGVRPDEVVVGCQLSSHGTMRVYPWEQFCILADICPEYKFVWFSDNPEHKKLSDLPGNVINTSDQLTCYEYLTLLACCDIIVTPDTAAMHLGPRFGLPTVVLSGSTKVKYHMKYYEEALFHVVSAKLRCSPCFDWQLRNDCYGKAEYPWCMVAIQPEAIRARLDEIAKGDIRRG